MALPAPTVSTAAGRGTTTRRIAALPIATTIPPAIATTIWVFGWPIRHPFAKVFFQGKTSGERSCPAAGPASRNPGSNNATVVPFSSPRVERWHHRFFPDGRVPGLFPEDSLRIVYLHSHLYAGFFVIFRSEFFLSKYPQSLCGFYPHSWLSFCYPASLQ